MEVVVINEHVTEYPDPILLKEGERVQLGETDDEYPNWIMVTTKAGKKGWVPEQYLKKSLQDDIGIVLRDYDAIELNTVLGEKLTVQFELNSWYRVNRKNGQVGWVPVETVKQT